MINRALSSKIFRHYIKSPLVILSTLLLLLYAIVAIFAPLVAPHDPYDLTTFSLQDSLRPPVWGEDGKFVFLLGTDEQGRGVLSTIIYGLRTSLMVGFGVAFFAGTFGSLVGLVAGYYSGIISSVLMRAADITYSFPAVMVAILLMGLIDAQGILIVIFALSVIAWVRYARTMRSKVITEKEKEYVEAAEAIGMSDRKIIFHTLLPNCIAPAVVIAAINIASMIMLEATLSYLGVGVPLTKPSLGQMIRSGKEYLRAGDWWLVVFPGLTLILLVLALNIIGDWFRVELTRKRRVG